MSSRVSYRAAVTAAALLSCTFACGDEPAQAPPATATARVQGEMELSTETVVRARNPIGPLAVNGEDVGPIVRWVLDKSATAPGADAARDALGDIKLASETVADTLAIRVAAPLSAGGISYASLLTLGIPARTACVIDEAAGETRVSYLLADLEIAGPGPITVSEHTGSCRIAAQGGDVSVHLVLPQNGHCIVSTGAGRITVRVPHSSSAQVSLQAADGVIAVTNLTLTHVVQTSNSLTGVLGSGAGAILLMTGAGDIDLIGY